MKAEDIRKKLSLELNSQWNHKADSNEIIESQLLFDKPKMFEPPKIDKLKLQPNAMDEQAIRGIGFENKTGVLKKQTQQEIYNMKELINSNPEGMQIFSYDTKVVKAQMALVKKRDWQEILFQDIDWKQPIHITAGLKRIFNF